MSAIFIFSNGHKNRFLRVSFTLILFLSSFSLFPQKKSGTTNVFPNVHLKHIVLPHETFTTIGQLYGIRGEDIAEYNNLEYYDEEVIPKYVTIPLSKQNFSKEKRVFSNELLVPLYYIRGNAKTLFRLKKNGPNKMVRRVNGRILLAGYLHTTKVDQKVFQIASPGTPEPTAIVGYSKRKDTVSNTKQKDKFSLASNQQTTPVATVIKNKANFLSKGAPLITRLPEKKEAFAEVIEPQPRSVSRVQKVLFLVKVQLSISIFLVALIFLYTAIRNRKEILNAKLNGSIRKVLIDEILGGNSFSGRINKALSTSLFLKKQLSKKANRQFIIDEIINGRKSIKGEVGDNFLKLYLALNLDKDSANKLKSKNWNNVVKGIQELAIMEQNHKMTEIFREINSKNEFIRMEAQSALLRLSGFGGLWFLNVLNYPISEWQQVKLLSILATSPVSDIPDLRLLLDSPNQSLVIFTLKLIGLFKQRTMHNEVVKALGNKSEAIRFFAVKCLKEIHNEYTASVLIRRFATETRRNKIAIVKVIGEIGDQGQTDFLLDVLSLGDDTFRILAATALSKQGIKGNYLLEEYCDKIGGQYSEILLHTKSAV